MNFQELPQQMIELIESKRTELEKAIEQTFKIAVATDEDEIMASRIISIRWGKSPNDLSTSHFGQER